MKYIVILCDGMAGYPLESFGGRTSMETADKKYMDSLAKKSTLGLVKTVPEGLPAGSDVANLSTMGFNPLKCYTGRSPLEAVSIGVEMKETDIAFRCNLVTLTDEKNYADKTMADYSAEEITTEESHQLISTINNHFKTEDILFYPGISYRHCMIWAKGPKDLDLTPPHDISDKVIGAHLPKLPLLREMMEKSYEILKDHPVNIQRMKKGLNPANSIWLWGEGTKPSVPDFYQVHGLKGSVISAVDLIKGIGLSAGMDVIEVEGATGNINTNFDNKCAVAYDALKNGCDYVYIHVEAPDECGHRGEAENKVKSIEFIDKKIVGPLVDKLTEDGETFAMMILPDHPTPIATKTHARDAVPFLIYRSNEISKGAQIFSEQSAKDTGLYFDDGESLTRYFLNK